MPLHPNREYADRQGQVARHKNWRCNYVFLAASLTKSHAFCDSIQNVVKKKYSYFQIMNDGIFFFLTLILLYFLIEDRRRSEDEEVVKSMQR